jgi:hypothetical protein
VGCPTREIPFASAGRVEEEERVTEEWRTLDPWDAAEVLQAELNGLQHDWLAADFAAECERERLEQPARYVTYKEASRIFGLAVGTIRERVKRDGVEVIGTGGTHRVHLRSLREALLIRPAHHREPVKPPGIVRRRRQVSPSDRTFTRLSRALVTHTRGGGA